MEWIANLYKLWQMHKQNKKNHIETKIQPWVDHDETFVRFNVLYFLC